MLSYMCQRLWGASEETFFHSFDHFSLYIGTLLFISCIVVSFEMLEIL